MAFSNKSKELREEFNLTQAQLAKEINISRSCISMIEIGKNEPTATTLIAYADYFKISIDDLLERDNADPSIATAPHDSYSSEEREIIKKYRELNAPGQKLIKQTLDTLYSTSEKTIKNRKA